MKCKICKSAKNKIFINGNIKILKKNIIDVKCTSMSHAIKPTLYKCINCKIVFSQFLNHKFEKLYKDVIDEEYLNQIKIKKKYFKNFINIIKNHINPNDEVLEVGSYYGVLGSLLKEKVKHYEGIEFSKYASMYAKKNYNLKIKSRYSQIKKKFNLIILCDVIEHVDNPLPFIKKLKSFLRKDGKIILSTMNIDSIYAKFLGKNYPWIMPMHKFYFSFTSMNHILKIEKLKIIEYFYDQKITSLAYVLKKILNIFFNVKKIKKNNFFIEFLNKIYLKINFFDLVIFVIK